MRRENPRHETSCRSHRSWICRQRPTSKSLRRMPVPVRGTLVSSGERSDAAAKALGLERAYKNVDEIAADPAVTVVHICTPNYVHFEQSAKLLRAGKHVLCEKPLAMDSRESAQLCRSCQRNQPRRRRRAQSALLPAVRPGEGR